VKFFQQVKYAKTQVNSHKTSEAVAESSGELPLPVTIDTVIAYLRKLGQHIAMFSEVVKLM
jgi:hypothetical protein